MHDHDDVRYALQQVVMHVATPVPLTVATCILIVKAHRWEDDQSSEKSVMENRRCKHSFGPIQSPFFTRLSKFGVCTS